jgi:hypothetical protein
MIADRIAVILERGKSGQAETLSPPPFSRVRATSSQRRIFVLTRTLLGVISAAHRPFEWDFVRLLSRSAPEIAVLIHGVRMVPLAFTTHLRESF